MIILHQFPDCDVFHQIHDVSSQTPEHSARGESLLLRNFIGLTEKMESIVLEPSMTTIKAIAILDNEGKRVFSKYYDATFPSFKEQRDFEESLFKKTKDANCEIVMLDGITCVYRSNVDLFFYVMGSQSENEIMLFSVLSGLFDAFSLLLKRHVEKRQLYDKMDAAMLIVDEMVDGGVILEVDPHIIIQRAAVKGDDGTFSENTVANAIEKAKDFKWTSIFGGGR